MSKLTLEQRFKIWFDNNKPNRDSVEYYDDLTDEDKSKFLDSRDIPTESTTIIANTLNATTGATFKVAVPLEIYWEPKEDITTFELAECMGILLKRTHIMPNEVDETKSYVRHFRIINHNK